jgi:general secretion pathway protein D
LHDSGDSGVNFTEGSVSLRVAILILAAAGLAAGGESAASMFKKARKAEKTGNFTDAYIYASQAYARAPDNDEYWAYSQALRRQGMAGMKLNLPPLAPAEEAPSFPGITEDDLREARTLLPPPILRGSMGKRSFDVEGNYKELFEKVLPAFGVQVVFDSDYQEGRKTRFRVDDLTFFEALRSLESVTSSFAVAVSERVALIGKDTDPKRREIEPTMTVVIPFQEPLSPQDVQEAARAVQSTFDITKMGIDNARRLVMFRDRVSRLRPALALFRQLMVHRGQVAFEVELLSVNKDSSLDYGLQLQSLYQIVPLVANAALNALPGLGGFALQFTDSLVVAGMTRNQAVLLSKSELLSLDGQAASFHLGDRYPVLTSGFYGEGAESPGTYRPPPSVNFEDLGIVIKLTPRIHNAADVSFQLEAEFKTLTGETTNGIPVIANRKFSSTARMKFGETAVLAGLVRDTISQSWSGLPILSLVPALRLNSRTRETTQLLLTIRPRLVSLPPTETPSTPVWPGTETRPVTPVDTDSR